MEWVEDADGKEYQLLKRSTSSWLVRSVASGAIAYLPADDLTIKQKTSHPSKQDLPPDMPHRACLDILYLLREHNGLPSRELLDMTTLCESDLFVSLRELELGDYIVRDVDTIEPLWKITERGTETIALED